MEPADISTQRICLYQSELNPGTCLMVEGGYSRYEQSGYI